MNPEYFLYKMKWWEVQRFIDGFRKRQRPIWETSRWLGWVVSRIMGGKSDEPSDMMTFPWEEDIVDPEEDAKAAAALIAACRAENERNAKNYDNKNSA